MNPTSQSHQTDKINTVLQQAEALNTQISMNIQFKKNMDFFKIASDEIYSMFKNYTPSLQKLIYDPRGFINLINTTNNKPVFNEDPVLYAKKQVNNFCEKPKRLSVIYKEMPVISKSEIYAKIHNETYKTYEDLTKNRNFSRSYPIGLLTIVGIGMGYHLEEIIKKINFKHIFIYESSKDSFFSSLFTIDWSTISKSTSTKNISLSICVGKTSNIALHKMQSLAQTIGHHNMVHNYLYGHTSNTENKEFYDEYCKTFPLIISSLGYFDDEIISFSHTIHNMNNNLPIFTPPENINKNDIKLPPVFLIGNGPSLDGELVDFLKKQNNKAIIISCGSSLGSLYNLGLRPDMHVDIERNLSVAEAHAASTDIEYTKDIPFLGLNTIVPDIKNLFENVYIALKPNDLGAIILNSEIPKNDFFQLELCNPTVTNGGLSYAIHMGFKDIYLFGYDFGMAEEKNHHSKHSFYSKIEKDLNENISKRKIKGDFKFKNSKFFTKGNLSDTVQTNNILDLSKKNIEEKLQKHKNIKCINPNNGAFIRGAKPTKICNVNFDKIENIKDKKIIISRILNNQFTKYNFNKIRETHIYNNYFKDIEKTSNSLSIPSTINDINEFHEITDRIFSYLKALKNNKPINYALFSGSVLQFICIMHSYLYKSKNNNELIKLYEIGSIKYMEMIDKFKNRLKSNLLVTSDTTIFDNE